MRGRDIIDTPRHRPPVDSNFDALRSFATLLVIYGNGWVLAAGVGPGLWGSPFARVGLDLLFAMSGYRIACAWERRPEWRAFLARRVARALPGLVAAVLVTMLIIGPLATTLSLRFYMLNGMTAKYLANIYLHPELYLPGVFRGRQWNGTVNPMLWTLRLGVPCILAVPLIARLPRRFATAAFAACGLLAAAAYLMLEFAYPQWQPSLMRLNARDVVVELPFFFSGALLAGAASAGGAAIWRADVAILLFAANWACAAWIGEANIVLEWLSLPYMAICFGRMAMPGLASLRRRVGDPSYGLYLYAFPIQQLVLERLPGDIFPILTCGVLTVGVALLSWHLVERPALDWVGAGARLPWSRRVPARVGR